MNMRAAGPVTSSRVMATGCSGRLCRQSPAARSRVPAVFQDAVAEVFQHGVGVVELVADGAKVVADAAEVLAAGDGHERDAERARELVRPARVQLLRVERAVLALRVMKFDACASCASSCWDGARP
jgi:hypothetical protein